MNYILESWESWEPWGTWGTWELNTLNNLWKQMALASASRMGLQVVSGIAQGRLHLPQVAVAQHLRLCNHDGKVWQGTSRSPKSTLDFTDVGDKMTEYVNPARSKSNGEDFPSWWRDFGRQQNIKNSEATSLGVSKTDLLTYQNGFEYFDHWPLLEPDSYPSTSKKHEF